jgi:hypothetical protein
VPIPDYETMMLPLLKFVSDTNEYSKVAIELWKQITNPILTIDYLKLVIIFVEIFALAVLATYSCVIMIS